METDLKLYTAAERIEVDAMKVLCEPFTGSIAKDGKIYYYEFSPYCIALVSGSEVMFANRVLGTGIDNEMSEQLIQEIMYFFKKASRPKFFIQPSPLTAPSNVHELLTEYGGIHHNNWVKLAKPTGERITAGEGIVVRTAWEEEAETIATILINAFGWPPELHRFCEQCLGIEGWTNYVALFNNRIEGTGSIFINNGNAELGMAATNAVARKHGIQSALVAVRAAYAKQHDCKYMFVETAEPTADYPAPSWRNMVRLGFTELYKRPNYLFKS